jgi:hypothetical protein
VGIPKSDVRGNKREAQRALSDFAAAHPLNVTAAHIIQTLQQGPPDRTPVARATITLEAVKVSDERADDGASLTKPISLWVGSPVNNGRPGGEGGATNYPPGAGSRSAHG